MRRASPRILSASVAFALSALASLPVHAASAYKCTAADGAISFQDQPCRANARQQRVPLPSDPYVAPTAVDDDSAAIDPPVKTNAPTPNVAPSPRTLPPSFFLCSRYDGGRYVSETGKGAGAAVPFGVLEDAQAFGAGAPAPGGGHQPSRVAAATAGAYVWVDDQCHRASPREACAYLQSQLDDVLARIRSVSMDQEAPLEQQAQDLRDRMRGC